MGLFRLWWIPQGQHPRHGWYVRYPADDLLGIVALESHRAGAFIVGEDLGTVEPGVRERLAARRCVSCRLLWFETRPPREYPELAMASVTTHDLPTIAGLWSGADEAAQRAIGLTVGDGMQNLREQLRSLLELDDDAEVDDVIERAYRRLAEAPSRIVFPRWKTPRLWPRGPTCPARSTSGPTGRSHFLKTSRP